MLSLCCAASAFACGCHSPLSEGVAAFEQARYPDAASHLRSVEPGQLSEAQRARLALYAGLTELALGNLDRAARQLSRAECQLFADPSALSRTERGRLESAWRSVGKMPGQALLPDPDCSRYP